VFQIKKISFVKKIVIADNSGVFKAGGGGGSLPCYTNGNKQTLSIMVDYGYTA
jgi:hypothetical protein